jgi:predicted MFS family arabinose efflux permease
MIKLNLIARVAKLVALLAFFLPWILVSCSGNEIAHGSGWDMMVGHLQPSDQINGLQAQFGNEHSQQQMDRPAPEIFAIAAFAVIALGLLVSFALKRRAAAGVMLATSLIGIGLCFGAFEHIKSAMHEQVEHAARKQHNQLGIDLGGSVEGAVRFEKQEGFWVTIIALVVAATMSGAVLTRRRETAPDVSDVSE